MTDDTSSAGCPKWLKGKVYILINTIVVENNNVRLIFYSPCTRKLSKILDFYGMITTPGRAPDVSRTRCSVFLVAQEGFWEWLLINFGHTYTA